VHSLASYMIGNLIDLLVSANNPKSFGVAGCFFRGNLTTVFNN
jgi:hypothetical protein